MSLIFNQLRTAGVNRLCKSLFYRYTNQCSKTSKFIFFSYSTQSTMPSAVLILGPGAEDMETVITADILRRAGVDLTIAGIKGTDVVQCSNKTVIKPDKSLGDVKNKLFDALIMPGGMGGTQAMIDSAEFGEFLKEHEKNNKIVAAICAAPTALLAHKAFLGKKLTSYPSMKEKLVSDYKYCEDNVVVDGNLVTSRGPGTAYLFGLKLAHLLAGEEKACKVAKACLMNMPE